LLRKLDYEGAPLLLALVLGPKLEVAFRQSLMISHGDFGIFVDRPISLGFLVATGLFLLMPLFRAVQKSIRKGGNGRG
jgi:putative tricarboxylic transport membrane protein